MGIIDSIRDSLQTLRQTVATDDNHRREYLRRESQIGATLFGPIPAGVTRDFFCLDETTWVWHESWVDADGQTQHVSTRYDVYPNTIIKTQNGQPMPMTVQELENFTKAVSAYYPLVAQQVYGVELQPAYR